MMFQQHNFTEDDLNQLIARAKTNDARLYLLNRRSFVYLTVSASFVIINIFAIYFFQMIASGYEFSNSLPKQIEDILKLDNNIIYAQIINVIAALFLIITMIKSYLESVRIRRARRRLEIAIREAEISAAQHD